MKSFFAVVILFVSSLYANTPAIDSLKQRIEHLEFERDNLRESFENKKVGLENHSSKELLRIEKDLNDKYLYIILISSLISLISISAVIGWIKNRNKWIKKKLEELFERELHDNQKTLIEMIYKKEGELSLKKEKKIVVISPDGENIQFFKKAFTAWGFSNGNVTYRTINEWNRTVIADLVILNNFEGQLSFDKMKSIIEELPAKTLSIYCGDRNGSVKIIEKEEVEAPKKKTERIDLHPDNFVNAEPQFYGNLMNTLHHHDALHKNSKCDGSGY